MKNLEEDDNGVHYQEISPRTNYGDDLYEDNIHDNQQPSPIREGSETILYGVHSSEWKHCPLRGRDDIVRTT